MRARTALRAQGEVEPGQKPGWRLLSDYAAGGNRSVVAWAVAGFLCGTVFWHLVGFWDFVGRIMFKDPAFRTAVTLAPSPPRTDPIKLASRLDEAPVENGSSDPVCLALRRSQETGLTSAEPCPADPAPLKVGNFLRRGDLAMFGPLPSAERNTEAGITSGWSSWSTTVTGSISASSAARIGSSD